MAGLSLDAGLNYNNFGLHGTTAVALPYKDGVILAVESRTTNEKCPKTTIKIRDTVKKIFAISERTLGIMIGDSNDAMRLKSELMENCAHMVSVADVFETARKYVEGERKQKKNFGTILCGSDAEGVQTRLFSVYVNDDEIVTTTNLAFLSLGSGRLHAKQTACKLLGLRDEAELAGYTYDMPLEAGLDLVLRCVFDSTFHNLSSGGTIYAYYVTNESWTHLRTTDIFEAYSNFYQFYEEDSILFLILNCKRGDYLCSKDLIAYFRSYGQINSAHRVCQITVDGGHDFFFHRLVCETSQDAAAIYSHVTEAGPYDLKETLNPSIKKLMNAFPYKVTVNVKEKNIPLYVSRASNELLDLLSTHRVIDDEFIDEYAHF